MFTARRTLTGITVLGLLIALAVFHWQRGDAPAEDRAGGALPPFDDAGTARQAAPAAAPATNPTPSAASGNDDEASGICAQIIEDATAFAEMERDAAGLLDAKTSDDQISAERESLPQSLIGSPDAELFLTALLVEPSWQVADDPSANSRWFELGRYAVDSRSPLLAWHALRACVEAEEYCAYPHLEQGLLETDRDNAEAWALVATLRYRRGDVAGALAAIQDAARASTSTSYLAETVAMTERSLAEHTAIPYTNRLILTSLAETKILSRAGVNRMCRDESAASRAWAEACLALGTLQGEHNETDLGRLIAFRIREQALTALGDIEGAAEVAEEDALYRVERSGVLSLLFGTANSLGWVLVSTDPERLHTYLDAVRERGEVEGSRRFLRQELPPLLERAGLLDQKGARECVARFFEPPAAVGALSATFRDYPVEDYPIQVGDQLQVAVIGSESRENSVQVGPDGTITLRRPSASSRGEDPIIVAAVGKTTGQIEREIATIMSERRPSSPPSEVFVILAFSRSPEELQLEFDNALREAAESREDPR